MVVYGQGKASLIRIPETEKAMLKIEQCWIIQLRVERSLYNKPDRATDKKSSRVRSLYIFHFHMINNIAQNPNRATVLIV